MMILTRANYCSTAKLKTTAKFLYHAYGLLGASIRQSPRTEVVVINYERSRASLMFC